MVVHGKMKTVSFVLFGAVAGILERVLCIPVATIMLPPFAKVDLFWWFAKTRVWVSPGPGPVKRK